MSFSSPLFSYDGRQLVVRMCAYFWLIIKFAIANDVALLLSSIKREQFSRYTHLMFLQSSYHDCHFGKHSL